MTRKFRHRGKFLTFLNWVIFSSNFSCLGGFLCSIWYFIYISTTLSLHVGQLDIFQDCGSGACYNFPIWNKNASIIYPFLIIIISFSAIPGPFQFYSNISWACHSSESQSGIWGVYFMDFQLWINDITQCLKVIQIGSK